MGTILRILLDSGHPFWQIAAAPESVKAPFTTIWGA
jgi:hypothetical protein